MLKTMDWIVLGLEMTMILSIAVIVIVSTIRFKRAQKKKEER